MTSPWIVVPNLNEAKDQFDKRFPKRDDASDGSIGNTAHSTHASSHNPDKSGYPEWRDGDSKNEVRARDFDRDLKDPDYTMESVVQLWVKLARAGTLWWVRYIIYNGRIWHKKDGFKTRVYTGANQHTEHMHITSDFTEKADTVTGVNWHLGDLVPKSGGQGGGEVVSPAPKPAAPESLVVDGKLGPKTITRWQQIMHTPVDGKIDADRSELIVAVQRRLRDTVDHRVDVDGKLGPETIGALQRYLKSPVDRVISEPVSLVVKALQRRLNTGKF